MTVRQTAIRLEISQSCVYALIAAGKLKAMRHGLGRGRIRVSETQLEAYLREAQGIPAPRRGIQEPMRL
jgi:excisionase family DNA binding protein